MNEKKRLQKKAHVGKKTREKGRTDVFFLGGGGGGLSIRIIKLNNNYILCILLYR